MSAYRHGEFHAFEGGGQTIFIVPSAAIFALKPVGSVARSAKGP